MSNIADKLTTIAENQQKIYDKGKEDMWSRITVNGTRKNYTRAFNNQDFSGETVPDNLIPRESSSQMFYNYAGTEYPLGVDLSNVPSDVAANASTTAALYSWSIHITYIYDMKLPAPMGYNSTFSTCRKLKTIEKVRVHKDTTFSNTFLSCNSLENIEFEGVIGQDISFAESRLLSAASLDNIVSHLKDYSTEAPNTHTITLHADCWTDELRARVTALGWKALPEI